MLGRLQDIRDGKAFFAADLAGNLAWGDEQAGTGCKRSMISSRSKGWKCPERTGRATSGRARSAPTRRRRSWIWRMRGSAPSSGRRATGPIWTGWAAHPRCGGLPDSATGSDTIPGLYILGLDWLHTAKSGLFAGIGEDAAYLAAQIAERAGAL